MEKYEVMYKDLNLKEKVLKKGDVYIIYKKTKTSLHLINERTLEKVTVDKKEFEAFRQIWYLERR